MLQFQRWLRGRPWAPKLASSSIDGTVPLARYHRCFLDFFSLFLKLEDEEYSEFRHGIVDSPSEKLTTDYNYRSMYACVHA